MSYSLNFDTNIGIDYLSSVESNQLNDIQENPQSFNPLLIPKTRIETYQDLITNLSSNELEELERKMQLLPNDNQDINIDLVLKAIREPDTLDPIWNHLDFPLYALLALKQGKMDGMDFSTSQMFYNVINHPANKSQIQEISLFINDSNNPQAWELIKETVQPFISQNHEEIAKDKSYNNIEPFMTVSQQQVFFDMMRQLRPLQKMFLLIPEPNPVFSKRRLEIQNSKGTITEVINSKVPGFNVFCRVSNKEFGRPLRMIPSKGMMQAYLFATGGDCTLISQFGLASFQYLRKGVTDNERCMCLNAYFLPEFVTQADTATCLPQANEVEYHDLYHIDIMNLIRKDLLKFAGMAEIIQKISETKQSLSEESNLFNQVWIDMEHLAYRFYYSSKDLLNTYKEVTEDLFWASFGFSLQKLRHSYSLIQAIIEELVEEADYYQKEYKLNIDLLLDSDLNSSLLMRGGFFAPCMNNVISVLKNKLKFDYYTPLEKIKASSQHPRSYLIRNAASCELAKVSDFESN